MKRVAKKFIAAAFATTAIAIEIPKKVQRKIVTAAPELDLNGDG